MSTFHPLLAPPLDVLLLVPHGKYVVTIKFTSWTIDCNFLTYPTKNSLRSSNLFLEEYVVIFEFIVWRVCCHRWTVLMQNALTLSHGNIVVITKCIVWTVPCHHWTYSMRDTMSWSSCSKFYRFMMQLKKKMYIQDRGTALNPKFPNDIKSIM